MSGLPKWQQLSKMQVLVYMFIRNTIFVFVIGFYPAKQPCLSVQPHLQRSLKNRILDEYTIFYLRLRPCRIRFSHRFFISLNSCPCNFPVLTMFDTFLSFQFTFEAVGSFECSFEFCINFIQNSKELFFM